MNTLSAPIHTGDHIQGTLGAECTLVEFGDYQCPSCADAHSIIKSLQTHFGKRLLFVYRHFPLVQLHPWAEPAAEAAEFAGHHDRFWEMHDLLYENQDELGNELFCKLATALDLSPSQMEIAVDSRSFRTHVRSDVAGGVSSGVNGTPTLFINGTLYDGLYDVTSLGNAIEHAPKLTYGLTG